MKNMIFINNIYSRRGWVMKSWLIRMILCFSLWQNKMPFSSIFWISLKSTIFGYHILVLRTGDFFASKKTIWATKSAELLQWQVFCTGAFHPTPVQFKDFSITQVQFKDFHHIRVRSGWPARPQTDMQVCGFQELSEAEALFHFGIPSLFAKDTSLLQLRRSP